MPNSWKKATVVPLLKKGDATQASNYRPITNVPIMSKIIEKIIYKQLSSYMERNHLYSEDQHGFKPGHSTTTALMTVTDNILTGMDNSEVSLMTLIDLSRCFDVIDEFLHVCRTCYEVLFGFGLICIHEPLSTRWIRK